MRDVDEGTFTPTERELWQRLQAHAFGNAEAEFDFTTRLAREQGWSRAEALAALEEYRRYCFLAVCAGHVVTPGPGVDQVWHLHLTYTRDYWERFCPQVLGRTLHHEPTQGGRAEATKHHAQYADTLASYHRWFGPPPARWWPDLHTCLYRGERYRWVDLDTRFLLPRPRWPGLRQRVAGLVALLGLCTAPLVFAADGLPANPLDWDGPAFLKLYIVLMIVGTIAGRLWRRHLRENGSPPSQASLPPLEVAYLAGGKQRVADAAVAELLQRKALRWDETKRAFEVTSYSDRLSEPLTRVVGLLREDGRPFKLGRRMEPALGSIRRQLASRGLVLDAAAQARVRRMPLLIDAGLILFAGVKIMVGLERGKPVSFLVILIVLTALFAFIGLFKPNDVSRAGDRTLALLRRDKVHTTRAPREQDLPLAVALAGTAVLATTAYGFYHQARASSPGGCSSGSSCSSGGDGGSSCGGGGCGGCGGGGGD